MSRLHLHRGGRVIPIGLLALAGFSFVARGQQAAPTAGKGVSDGAGINMPSNTGSAAAQRGKPSTGFSGALPPGVTQLQPTTPGVVVVPTGKVFSAGGAADAAQGDGDSLGQQPAGPTGPTGTGPAAGTRLGSVSSSTASTVGAAAGLGPIQNTIIRRMVGSLLGTGFRMADAGPPEVAFVTGSNGWMYGDTTIVPRRDLTVTADGVDIRLTYTNSTNRALPVGTIQVSDIRLGDRVEVLDARHGVEHFDVFDRVATPLKVYNNGWPGDLYSPIAVLRDERYTVGVSLQYPALEYRHGVNIRVGDGARWSGDGGPYWRVRMDIPSTIEPGQSRVYTLSVRVAPRTESWLKTLVPYRDYFQATYGGVRYQRDPRPVTSAVVAFSDDASPGNTRGFAFPNLRPDINGWRPWSREITARRSLGYQRSMIWAAAGIYSQNRDKNYPSNSLSPMDDIPLMRNSKAELANAASPNMQIGYWLGLSTQYETAWDTPTPPRKITLGNAEQEGYFFRELDFAASLNATLIGLDAFSSDDPYFLYSWLTKMKQRQPNIKFIAELSPPDIIHGLAGSFLFEWNVAENEKPLLADFLLPGHETWISIWGQALRRELGRRPTIAEFVRTYQRYSDAGYIVLDVSAVTIPPSIVAARGWETSVPAELRTPVGGPSGAARQSNAGSGTTPPGGAGEAPAGSEPPVPPPPGTNTRLNGPQPAAPAGTAPPSGPQMLSSRRARINLNPGQQPVSQSTTQSSAGGPDR